MSAILDRIVSHQIGLERAKAGEANGIVKSLKPLDLEIEKIINSLPDNYTQKQLNAALRKISKTIDGFYNLIMQPKFLTVGVDSVAVEVPFAVETVNKFLNPERINIKSPTRKSVINEAVNKLYQGKTMSQWVTDLGTDKKNRVTKSIRVGAIDNEPVNKLVTRSKRAIKIANNNSKSISNAHVGQFTNVSRDKVYDINDDKAKEIIWSSILDSGTTQTCAVRSNQRYNAKTKEPIGHFNSYEGGPGIIHYNCRSLAVPTSTDGFITSGPGKDKKYSDGTRTAIGGEEGYERGGDLNAAGKRAKVPTPNNQVEKQLLPATTDYDIWMKKQPRAFVEDSLGVGKARLFLDEKVPLQSFVTPEGRELTLKEIVGNL